MLLAAISVAAVLDCDDAPREVQLAERVAQAFCAHQFDCCAPIEISLLASDRYTTEADCVSFATLAARQQLGTIQGAIAQGRVSIDEATADACVAAYRHRACNTSVQTPEAISALPNVAEVLAFCPDMLVGHVPDDRPCDLPQECLPGSRCLASTPPVVNPGYGGAPGGPAANPGICAPYQKAGERCNQTSDCDPSHLACRTPEFLCGLPAQEGEACTAEYDMFTGASTSNCDTSRRLYCDNVVSAVCRHYPRDGEPCSPFGPPQCDPDAALALSCNPFTGTCQRPGDEGDPCGATARAIPPCRDDLACHPTQSDGIGVCGAVPALGQACADRCASPALCIAGTCGLPGPAPLGADCQLNTDCASLACAAFKPTTGTLVCGPSFDIVPRCVGAGVTQGSIQGPGNPGIGGSIGTGVAGKGMPPAGTAGAGGSGAGGGGGNGGLLGCPVSEFPIGDPFIADFSMDAAGMPILPIGGTFTYGSPPPLAPTATVTDGAWHITLNAPGMVGAPQYLGVGITFNGDPTGTACVDATIHTGVQFDIGGSIDGIGCSAQYATKDSAHSISAGDPRGAGDSNAYAPQAPLMVTSTPTTVMMPFNGTGAPTGGNPAIAVDKSRLTGVQWQFTVAAGPSNVCIVDVTIDNVRFF